MKITIRGSVFETNSSSGHTFIFVSKETFEAWKRGEKKIKHNILDYVAREEDFVNSNKNRKIDKDRWEGTYEEVMEYYKQLGGEMVYRTEASKEHVDPEEWNMDENDEDCDIVYQRSFIDIKDNGKRVRIHFWGRGN
jgi:hypothetical protein